MIGSPSAQITEHLGYGTCVRHACHAEVRDPSFIELCKVVFCRLVLLPFSPFSSYLKAALQVPCEAQFRSICVLPDRCAFQKEISSLAGMRKSTHGNIT